MKIKAKYRDVYHNHHYRAFQDEQGSIDYYERSADCWLIGVTINQNLCKPELAIIALGDGEIQAVPLSAIRITDESYFTPSAQERLIAKYAIDDNGYVTGENILGKERKAIFKVGDKVKLTDKVKAQNFAWGLPPAEIGTVTNVNESYVSVEWTAGFCGCYFNSDLVHAGGDNT